MYYSHKKGKFQLTKHAFGFVVVVKTMFIPYIIGY